MTKLNIFVLKPEVVFSAQVNMASATYPLQSLTYDNVTAGSYENVKSGMLLAIGSAAGKSDYGRQIVFTQVATPTSTIIPILESSKGTVDGTLIADNNAYITVYNLFPLWMYPPFADELTGEMKKRRVVPIGNYGSKPLPVANGKPAVVIQADGTDTATITTFDASGSFAVAQGATISSKLWNFGSDATPISSTSDTPSVTLPVGFRYSELQVVDSNSAGAVKHIPTLVLPQTGTIEGQLTQYEVQSLDRTAEGSKLVFRFDQSLDEDDYPDGTLVLAWYDNPIGTIESAEGYEHLAFVGYHHSDTYSIAFTQKGKVRRHTMECLDVAGKLAVLAGFPQTVQRESSPNTWTKMSNFDIDKYLHYLLVWHSTALEIADFYWSGKGSIYPITILGSDGSSLYDQVNKRAEAIAHKFTCNRVGQLKVLPDPLLQDLADRPTIVNVSLTESDWGESGVSFTKKRTPDVYWNKGSAVVASTADASTVSKIDTVYCVAPDVAPSQGLSPNNSGEQLVTGQTELNHREGHRFERSNSPFNYLQVEVTNPAKMEVDPAEMYLVGLIMETYPTFRGFTLTETDRFLPISVSHSFDHSKNLMKTTVQLEKETVGRPAITVTYPEDATNEYPDDYVDPYLELPVDLPLLEDIATGDSDPDDSLSKAKGLNKLFMVGDDSYIYRTTNFSKTSASGGPTWARYAISGLSGTPITFVVNPFSAKYQRTGSQVDGWIVTSTGIYKVTNIQGTPSATLQKSFRASSSKRSIDASNAFEGYVGVVSRYSDGFYITHTEDGSTWSTESIIGVSTSVGSYNAGVSVSNHVQGNLYTSAKVTPPSLSDWSHTTDYTLTNGGYSSGTDFQAVYSSGVGWNSIPVEASPSNWYSALRIKKTFHFTGGSLIGSGEIVLITNAAADVSVHGNGGLWLNTTVGSSGTHTLTLNPSGYTPTSTLEVVITVILAQSSTEAAVSPYTATLTSITLAGQPTDIFGLDDVTGGSDGPNTDAYKGFISANNGTSLSESSSSVIPYIRPRMTTCGDIHVPYNNNPTDSIVYYGGSDSPIALGSYAGGYSSGHVYTITGVRGTGKKFDFDFFDDFVGNGGDFTITITDEQSSLSESITLNAYTGAYNNPNLLTATTTFNTKTDHTYTLVFSGTVHHAGGTNDLADAFFYTTDNVTWVAGKGIRLSGSPALYKAVGATISTITPQAGYSAYKDRQIDSAGRNRQYMCVALGDVASIGGISGGKVGVWVSKDSGTTWTTLVIPSSTTGKYDHCAMSDDGNNVVYVYGESGAIGYSGDRITVDSRKGNISTFSPTNIIEIGGY